MSTGPSVGLFIYVKTIDDAPSLNLCVSTVYSLQSVVGIDYILKKKKIVFIGPFNTIIRITELIYRELFRLASPIKMQLASL